MEKLLDQARKVSQDAEVFFVSSQSTEAVFEANRLKQVQTKESAGSALRLIREGRIGFAATTKVGSESELVEMALDMAPFGAEAKFEFPGSQSYPSVAVFDSEVESVTEETMVELGQSMIDRIISAEPEIVCEGSVSRRTSNVILRNSRGGEVNYQKSVFSVAIEGVLVRGTDMLFVGDYESSCHPVTSPDYIVQFVLQQLERAKEVALSPSGNIPVVFTPHGVASALVSPLAIAFNGKTVLRGASPVGHRKGETIFVAEFTLWDDSTIDFCPACSICDHEGVPSQRTPLVQDGMVSNFLYDLQTAGEAGAQSTGSASRSIGTLPSPSTSALIIEEGKAGFEEMVSEIKEGLVVEQLMGATQGNILGGDFSGNVLLGYKVENGQIVGRVKNTMVSGNVYELLKEGIVIGSDSRWLGGSLRTPSIYCPSVSVAAKD